MSKLKGKVAVVTGASKGIGADIAKALAAEGGIRSRKLRFQQVRRDIASVAVFLASDDSAWLTGERLLAGGGLR